jgi:3D (Asp-Asp-Asp) domain-containing protein
MIEMKTTLIFLLINFITFAPTSIVNIDKIELVGVEKITATMYNAIESQCDSDPFLTAGMYKINPSKASEHNWIAMSRNLLNRWGGNFNYGDIVIISNAGHKNGVYTVVDTMNPRFENRIDFLETTGTHHYIYENITIQKIRG